MYPVVYTRKALILVDVQNVFYGSRNYTNNKGRIDYEKLIEHIKGELKDFYTLPAHEFFGYELSEEEQAREDYVDSIVDAPAPQFDINATVFGYVVHTPKYKGMDFFAFLRRIGYSLRVRPFNEEQEEDEPWRGTTSSIMQMDFLEHCPDYDAVVIVSGSGVFEPAFRAAKKNWPTTTCMVAAFENTLHHTYDKDDNSLDHIIYLDESVLR